ncbi:hypothetical protein BB561_004095 [Smittium simulii]|uniref:Core-binding (CB) domain-containing protein n=1 Tax=Smittium simulii TaxID=133385 RepID=A0A2T9YI07_9FUNG|nr:hypothetical protein BB561_004095 [Smittium simulii]
MSIATLQRIEKLTDKVNQLMLARETVPAPITVPEPENQSITTRAPASKLKIYPMHKDAIPSIEEDFFCIQLTEEERKNAIYSCPRSSFMNYLPPLLNDSASTAVRKADSTLHGIQVALVQATRPVDYYAHRIIQDNPGITSDDPRFLFADTMRFLLSDIAAIVTQGRLDNLHRGMYLPGKPQQLVESEVKYLMDQYKLDALIAQKAPAKRARIRKPFRGRQQFGTQNSTSSYTALAITTGAAIPANTANNHSKQSTFCGRVRGRIREGPSRNAQTNMGEAHGQPMDVNAQKTAALWATAIDDAPTLVQAEAQSRGPPDPDGESSIIADKESNRGSQNTRSRIFSQLFVIPKKTGGLRPVLDLRKLNSHTNLAKGLHDVSRSRRRIYAHSYTQFLQEVSALLLERESIPIQSAPVWTVSQPAHYYQGAPPDTIMGENTEHQNICIPGRHPNYWGVEKDMQEKYGPSIFQTDRAGIQNQVREVDNNAISVNNPSWYGNQFTEHEPQSSFLKDSGPPPRSNKTIESWPDNVKMPVELYWESPSYVGCPTPGSSNAETTLGTQEQVLIIDEDMDINCDTHRTRQAEPVPIVSLGDPRTGTLYRCQRHRLGGSCGLTILLRIVESFGGVDAHQRQRTINDIIRTPAPECCWSFGISLLRQYHHSSICKKVWCDEHAPPGYICSVCNESSGCTEPTDRADGMVNVRPGVLQNNGIIRATRCRPVCIENKHEASKLLQLVSRQQGCRSELPALQLVELEQPVLLPTMEPDIPGSPESAPRTSDYYSDNASMENSNVVSGPTEIISCPATAPTGNDGHTRPQKRKISAVEQQELVPHGMENQRRVLQAQVKRRSRYHSTQKHFLDWHLANNQSAPIQTSHIVNYLAHIFKTKKLSTNTIKSYKSAILNLVADPKTVGNSPCIKEFLRAINETEIKSFVNPEIDISPIVSRINEWGETSGLDNLKLTTKCCWLLSLCGYLRASDIHRIDDARTIITENTLKLRKGQPIERPCEINRHPNHILCPVLAYTVFKARIATELCMTPHANNVSIVVNRIFRHTMN